MATVAELQSQLATIEQELVPLRAAYEAAKIKSNEAEAALSAVTSQPGRVSLSQLVKAKNEAQAAPNNSQLQQQYSTLQSQWDAQLAQSAPLIAARDAAYAEQTKAGAPVVAKEADAANIEVEIAKIDPAQATPNAVQYLKETGGLPITTSSDPALTSNQPQSVENASPAPTTAQTNASVLTAIGVPTTAAPDTTDPSSANAVNGADLASDQATTAAAQRDPSSAEYISEADRLSDAASQQIAAQKDPSSAEYISEADRLSDAASQQIAAQKDPSSAEYVNESDRLSDAAAAAAAAEKNKNPAAPTVRGLKTNAQSQEIKRTTSAEFAKAGDWRVRLSLAPGADYLYKSPIETELGILAPLKATDGIVFPYTPSISIAYNASYDATELTHSNYKMYQYKASSVDNINITCDFTAQDTQEANYLLATIHFLRSVTKMFYGQDKAPAPGTPPPLVYLTGLGAFQFDRHPLAITNFNYTLPNEVDYIRAGKPASPAGAPTNTPAETNKPSLFSQVSAVAGRLFGSNLLAGAQKAPPQWKTIQTGKVTEPTYVPTKMSIQITAVPIVSRGDISNRFGLLKYGTGDLLRGSKNNTGGIW